MAQADEIGARDVRLRGLDDTDFEALADLHQRVIAAVPDNLATKQERSSWAHGITADHYAEVSAEGNETFVLAEYEGRIVGFASFRIKGGEGMISGLYVDPAWQRRGIGRRVSERVEAILRGRGAERVGVLASLAGRAAYGSLGYDEVGRARHRTRGGRLLPAVIMEKRLDGDWRNLYGRRHGKRLKPAQRQALERVHALSPGPVSREENPERRKLDLSPFGGLPAWLEIGFGGGEHLVHQACLHPEVRLIGADPFVNGVAMLAARLARGGPENVSIHAGDARDLIEVLPDACLSRVFLLYPDPWPKRRHHRRRFVTAEHLLPLARTMAPGAVLRIATDIPDYLAQARREVPRGGFRDVTTDDRRPWPDWCRTRYEAKALREGRRPFYLSYERH